MKKKYYVNLANGEINEKRADNTGLYIIYANENEVHELKSRLNNMQDWDLESYLRSHVPIMPYHNSPQNDNYDQNLKEAFYLIHELGDEEAKAHVESLGILSNHSNNEH